MTATNGHADRLGRYYTDLDVARCLVRLAPLRDHQVVLEPSAGGGAFLEALAERAAQEGIRLYMHALDSDDQAPALLGDGLLYQSSCSDFLAADYPCGWARPELVIGNPPYSVTGESGRRVAVARKHCERALQLTTRHVLFLLPHAFLGGTRRRIPFWRRHEQHLRALITLWPRPSFTGRGTDSREYAGYWFDLEHQGPTAHLFMQWRDVTTIEEDP